MTIDPGRTIPSRGFEKLEMSCKEPPMTAGNMVGGRERLGGH